MRDRCNRLSTPMSPNRRDFIRLSAAAGTAATLGVNPGRLFAAVDEKRAKPLNILILGGTGFTGPYQVRYALGRGHKVTTFNRGKSHPGELPNEVEQLIGDRNGKLDALKGRNWDVVIDNPTTLPVWVRDAAQILKGNVDRYVFISTISVYSDTSKLGMDETAPLAKYTGADAMKETQATLRANIEGLYGPLKALAEAEAEKWFPGKTLIIRPGYIVGPGDESDRFTFWPVRVERGGEVLAPGTPADPIQIIDARDLAEWTIRMVEQGATGPFNAVGPKSKLTMGRMLDGMKKTTNSDARFTWVDDKFLTDQKIIDDIPIWTSTHGPEIGYSTVNINKAVSNGLTFRPLADTTRATLDWFRKQRPDRQMKMRAGFSAQREAEVLAAWHASRK